MGAFAYDAKNCRGALGFTIFELTPFLAGHYKAEKCDGGRVGEVLSSIMGTAMSAAVEERGGQRRG
jgi:hypothetical protein